MSMNTLGPVLVVLAMIAIFVYMFVQQNRVRARNAPLRGEIEARVRYTTTLDLVSQLGTGGFWGGTRGMWIAVMKGGTKRLVVGTDAFLVAGPLGEYAFRGCESSIAFSQAPSRVVTRDWIIITGQHGTRQVQLAVTKNGSLTQIWKALAGTGAALVPPASELEQRGNFFPLGRTRGWRRVAVGFVSLALFMFMPALIIFIAHHLR